MGRWLKLRWASCLDKDHRGAQDVMSEPNHSQCFIHFAWTQHHREAFSGAFYSKEAAEAGKQSTKTCNERPEEQRLVFLVVLQHPLKVFLLPLDSHLTTELGLGPQRGRGSLGS